jgi:hypothetical protein
MSQKKSIPLIVWVKETVTVTDGLSVWKKWFNGAKHFFTVKVLPPRR